MLDISIKERLSEEFVIGKKGYMQRHIENLSLVILKVFLIITIYNGIAKADDKKVESHIIEFTQGQVAIIGNLLGAKYTLIVDFQCSESSTKINLTFNLVSCETSEIIWVGILNNIAPTQIIKEVNYELNQSY